MLANESTILTVCNFIHFFKALSAFGSFSKNSLDSFANILSLCGWMNKPVNGMTENIKIPGKLVIDLVANA